jgi:hypothetical protein
MPIHSTPITNIFYFLGIYVMYILLLFLFLLILWRFVRIMTIIFVEINMSSLMATFTTSTMTANHDHYYYYYYYYSIHFKEWSWTSQSLFIISHQKLIILFNYKEIWNQFIIFLKTSFSTLLLQEHIRGMKSR